MELEVVLPTTSSGVRELLLAVAHNLEKDAARYMKARKGCTETDPAVADKLDAATSIKELVSSLEARNKARWKNALKS